MKRYYKPSLKKNARNLRGNMTDAERKLWSKLRRKQIKSLQFFRQKPLGPYIVDFYCPRRALVIEVDGGQHFEEKSIESDKERDEYLRKSLKLQVVRFNNLDVLKNIDGVILKIMDYL